MNAPSANTLYRAAQDLIKQGQPVFPCWAKGKKVKAPIGTLVPNGLHDATLDRDTLKGWLQRAKSGAALGIPTGIVWDVLDVDVKRADEDGGDGRRHLHRLNQIGLLNGCKHVVRTPSGGFHLYFKAAPGLTNTARKTLGLDVRARGGYVLAPPSYIETDEYAGSYESLGHTTGSTDEPLLFDLIVSSIVPVDTDTHKPVELLGFERRASIGALRGWLSEREAGERNNSLHWAVCRCIENGIDPNELMEVALHIGLDEDEASLTINSAIRRAGVTVHELDSEAEAMFPEA